MNLTVYGVWNTTAGADSSLSTVGSNTGNYYTGEEADNVFDNSLNSKYTSFGVCNSSAGAIAAYCGVNTGFYFTVDSSAILLAGMRFGTPAALPSRDPITLTVEGSNQTPSVLSLGTSWTLFYNGSTGLNANPGRRAYGLRVNFTNSISYSSYRFLITSIRGVDTATQYAEVQLFGY